MGRARSLLAEFTRDAGGWGIASVSAAVVAFVLGLWEHTHGSAVPAFAFVCSSVPLFWAGAFVAWVKKYRRAEELRATPDGPHLGVEYHYSEEKNSGTAAAAPLVLTNTSTKDSAHNVRVMPLAVGKLQAAFEPRVLPFIEPLGRREVKARIDGVFPDLRHDLPVLFKRSYRDTNEKELFDEHLYTLRIEYENADNTKLFESAVELRYRPWRTRISVGVIRRGIKRPA
jgi:hypothetical protein